MRIGLPQRLKPEFKCDSNGAAEAAPFQSRPFQSRPFQIQPFQIQHFQNQHFQSESVVQEGGFTLVINWVADVRTSFSFTAGSDSFWLSAMQSGTVERRFVPDVVE